MPIIKGEDYNRLLQGATKDHLGLSIRLNNPARLPNNLDARFLNRYASVDDISLLRVLALQQMTKGLGIEKRNVTMKVAEQMFSVRLGAQIEQYYVGSTKGYTIALPSPNGSSVCIDIDPAFGFLWHLDLGSGVSDGALQKASIPLHGDGDESAIDLQTDDQSDHVVTASALAQWSNFDTGKAAEDTYDFLEDFFKHKHQVSHANSHFTGYNHSEALLALLDKEAWTVILRSEFGGAEMRFHLGKKTGLRWVSFWGSMPNTDTSQGNRYKEEISLSREASYLSDLADRFYRSR